MSEPEARVADVADAADIADATDIADAAEVSVEVTPDPVLLAARDQARAALEEITGSETIGGEDGFEAHEAHVLTLYFDCQMSGYPGWRWAATLARVDADSPVTVLEVELLPGADAVTAPDWVPWSERLAQYRDTQARQAAEGTGSGEDGASELRDEDEAEDDLLDNDFSDFDDEIDGVEIDELDSDDDSDDDDDDDDDDSEDDSDDDSDDEDRADESDDTELFDDSDDEEE